MLCMFLFWKPMMSPQCQQVAQVDFWQITKETRSQPVQFWGSEILIHKHVQGYAASVVMKHCCPSFVTQYRILKLFLQLNLDETQYCIVLISTLSRSFYLPAIQEIKRFLSWHLLFNPFAFQPSMFLLPCFSNVPVITVTCDDHFQTLHTVIVIIIIIIIVIIQTVGIGKTNAHLVKHTGQMVKKVNGITLVSSNQ